jgi:cytochrome P450
MTALISELELPHLAMEEEAFSADPYPHFDAARARHPWLATSNFGYVVTHYPVIRELFTNEQKMRGNYVEMVEMMGATDTPWGDFQLGHILNAQGEKHKRLRDILAPAFTPRQANRHRALMRGVMAELLDEWVPKGRFDFEEFLSWYPIGVFCRMMGAPSDAISELRDALEALGLSVSMDLSVLEAMQQGARQLEDFSIELIAEREKVHTSGDDNDLLDLLVEFKAQGKLAQAELTNLITFLLVAGYDTSKNIMTLMMYEMTRHPDIYRRCAEDIEYCARVVEESMRLHSTSNLMRLVTQDIEHRDVMIPAGTTLFFPWGVAARDPGAVDQADEFLPDRVNRNTHLGFGLGGHMCLGQFIARAQMAEGLHLIAQRIKNPRTEGPEGWRPFVGVWGMRGLPIDFDQG